MSMLHHISLPVADLERSAGFYDLVLSVLGYRRVCSGADYAGYGVLEDQDLFMLKRVSPSTPAGPGFHLAFSAPTAEAVDAFHRLALANGAMDNGAPGLRSRYGPGYYAAFVIDLDGHRIEAVHITAPV